MNSEWKVTFCAAIENDRLGLYCRENEPKFSPAVLHL